MSIDVDNVDLLMPNLLARDLQKLNCFTTLFLIITYRMHSIFARNHTVISNCLSSSICG
jgi:hypothetical protein